MEKTNKILCMDVMEGLKQLPDESINCIVTSPPYWGLRDYGEETNIIWDGNPECKHEWGEKVEGKKLRGTDAGERKEVFPKIHLSGSDFCSKCGAWRGQLGLEPTLDLYLKHMLEVTNELKRVLRKDGVMFWNHGDCYSQSGERDTSRWDSKEIADRPPIRMKSLPPKCMTLQHYRLILKMTDEQGWTLRNTIIWHKPNHMPSSVKDRFSNSYEPVFMLTKNKKYWFDLDAVREPHQTNGYKKFNRRVRDVKLERIASNQYRASESELENYKEEGTEQNPLGKNPGDVWKIPTQPFAQCHFATFPMKLVEPMIKAGCPKEICNKCGKPRVRIVDRELTDTEGWGTAKKDPHVAVQGSQSMIREGKGRAGTSIVNTKGFTDCGCGAGFRNGVVLDPFSGSGTTLLVARNLLRNYIGIELNPEYAEMAQKRLNKIPQRLDSFNEVEHGHA